MPIEFEKVQPSETQVTQAGHPVPTQDMTNSFIVPLPTKGLLYPEEHPFYRKDKIVVKNLTGEEVDIISNSSYLQNGLIYDMLLKSCIKLPNFNPKSLYGIDEDCIIAHLRINGIGYEHTPYEEVVCPKCKTKHDPYTYTIREMKYEEIEVEDLVSVPVQKFRGKTPYTVNQTMFKKEWNGKVIVYKLLTTEEKQALGELADKIEAKMGKASRSAMIFSEKVHSFDGETDKLKLQSIFKNMRYMEAKEISKFLFEPEFTMLTDFKCSNLTCKWEEEVKVDLDLTFLYPRPTQR